jgi:hypothetical protein
LLNGSKNRAYEWGWVMSTEELFDAYVEGQINRRSFIHGLTANGISQSSAILHAAALRPGSIALVDDLYDDGNHHEEKKKDKGR